MLPKIFLFPVAALAVCTGLFAQNKRQMETTNDNIDASIPDSVKYQYPAFVDGHVAFRDNIGTDAMLNYNLLSGEMHFINGRDTLAMANELNIRNITINQDTFYFDKVYLQRVIGSAIASLAKNSRINLEDIRKASGYGNYTSLGAVSHYNSVSNSTHTQYLSADRKLTFVTRVSYYIGDKYNHFLPATKKNVLNVFGNKKELESYITGNKIDFTKEDDLKKLINYISQ